MKIHNLIDFNCDILKLNTCELVNVENGTRTLDTRQFKFKFIIEGQEYCTNGYAKKVNICIKSVGERNLDDKQQFSSLYGSPICGQFICQLCLVLWHFQLANIAFKQRTAIIDCNVFV